VAVAIALAIAATKASAQQPVLTKEQGDEAIRTYMLCVRRMALRLEPSGDPPEAVAAAATAQCMEAGLPAMNYVIQARERGISPAKLGDDARYYGAAQAVTARLCRKTGDCALNHVP
jgi:xanthine/CO dehydrogenase XdhC/CoxF family maturation factor